MASISWQSWSYTQTSKIPTSLKGRDSLSLRACQNGSSPYFGLWRDPRSPERGKKGVKLRSQCLSAGLWRLWTSSFHRALLHAKPPILCCKIPATITLVNFLQPLKHCALYEFWMSKVLLGKFFLCCLPQSLFIPLLHLKHLWCVHIKIVILFCNLIPLETRLATQYMGKHWHVSCEINFFLLNKCH